MRKTVQSVIGVLLAICMIGGFAGCGKEDITWQDAYAYDLDECVRLGEYKGIEVKVPERTATAADVEAKIAEILDVYASYSLVEDYAAQMGDKVVMDYQGKVKGKAFDGGTSSDTTVILGDGALIEGFEEQLVGHKAGESFDINVTFPEDYSRSTLAGQDAVFSIQISQVYQKKVPAFDDGFAIANSNYGSAEEYRQAIIDEINTTKPDEVEEQKLYDCWDAAMDNFLVFYVPQDDMQNYYYSDYYYYYAMAKKQNMEMEDFLEAYMGMTETDFDGMINKLALAQEEELIVAMAICREEGFTVTDQMYKEQMETYAIDWGYKSANDFKKSTGQTVEEYYSSTMIYREIFMNMARQCVLDNCVEIPAD